MHNGVVDAVNSKATQEAKAVNRFDLRERFRNVASFGPMAPHPRVPFLLFTGYRGDDALERFRQAFLEMGEVAPIVVGQPIKWVLLFR